MEHITQVMLAELVVVRPVPVELEARKAALLNGNPCEREQSVFALVGEKAGHELSVPGDDGLARRGLIKALDGGLTKLEHGAGIVVRAFEALLTRCARLGRTADKGGERDGN